LRDAIGLPAQGAGEDDRVAVLGRERAVVGRAVSGEQCAPRLEVLALSVAMGDQDAAGGLRGDRFVQTSGVSGGEDVLEHLGDATE
jgi:hypothetical protein